MENRTKSKIKKVRAISEEEERKIFPNKKLASSVFVDVDLERIIMPRPMVEVRKIPIVESVGIFFAWPKNAKMMAKIKVTLKVIRKIPAVFSGSKNKLAKARPRSVE